MAKGPREKTLLEQARGAEFLGDVMGNPDNKQESGEICVMPSLNLRGRIPKVSQAPVDSSVFDETRTGQEILGDDSLTPKERERIYYQKVRSIFYR